MKMDRKNNRIMCGAGALALAAVFSLPRMLDLKGNTLAVSNSWFSVLAYGVFWFLCYRSMTEVRQEGGAGTDAGRGAEKKRRRGLTAAGAAACLFSLCIAFGVQLDHTESVDFRDGRMWLSVLVWSVVLTFWIYSGWIWLERRGNGSAGRAEDSRVTGKKRNGKKMRPYNRIQKWDSLPGKKQAAVLICFFLLCWLPVFLAAYPGFFVYDAQDELVQVQTRQFTTHHPLPHVLLLGGTVQAVYKLTGSYNAGIAVYTVMQMVCMAGVFTYVISFMKKSGVRRWLRAVGVFYYAFFPVNVMFVLCSAKDGLFSAALLLLLTALAQMAGQPETFWKDWKNTAVFGISALVMMCLRHNGMYAFLVLAPVMLFFYGKGVRRKMGCLVGIVFGSYILISSGLAGILQAQDSGNQEMLTVPIQQLARVWKYEKDSLTEEQKKTLYEILPEDVLPFYTAKVSDGVKRWFNNEAFAADPWKYAELWAKVGSRHPFTYLNAWFMTSYGFWYPDTVIDVYRGNGVFTFTYADSSFFGYEVELPGTRESKIPWLDGIYRKMSLEIAQQNIPAVSMLFSPGFLFWVFVFTGGYAYYRRKYEWLLPFCMILLLWLTVILGPTYLPRYVLILWFALPGALAVLVNGG